VIPGPGRFEPQRWVQRGTLLLASRLQTRPAMSFRYLVPSLFGACFAFQVACGSPASADGSDSATGGAASGGQNASGGSSSGGGAATGGASTGGTSSGGTSSGGTSSGGAAAGGSSSGGSGGALGTGGSVGASCPEAVPEDGVVPCQGFGTCLYEDCSGAGQTSATCDNAVYQTEVSPCQDFECGGETCTPGQICTVNAGGAFIGTCVDNPCGDGPVTCECGHPTCSGTCTAFGTPGYGIELTCNTCPNGQACP